MGCLINHTPASQPLSHPWILYPTHKYEPTNRSLTPSQWSHLFAVLSNLMSSYNWQCGPCHLQQICKTLLQSQSDPKLASHASLFLLIEGFESLAIHHPIGNLTTLIPFLVRQENKIILCNESVLMFVQDLYSSHRSITIWDLKLPLQHPYNGHLQSYNIIIVPARLPFEIDSQLIFANNWVNVLLQCSYRRYTVFTQQTCPTHFITTTAYILGLNYSFQKQ